MLRGAILALGLLLLVAGIAALALDALPLALWLLGVGGVITVGTLFERVVYKPLRRGPPGAGWVKTGESFIDTESGATVDVFHNPASGDRQYVRRGGDSGGQPG